MSSVRPFRTWCRFALAIGLALCGAAVSAQRADSTAAGTKLTTVLADLAAAVPQSSSQTSTSQSVAASGPLAVESMPKSAQDAVAGRRLRLNDAGEVQVYVLLSQVTDATVAQLTAQGATVEIRDADRRRVQARVPVSRLQSIAALGAVTSVRLPTYARRRAGAASTEGDYILHSDVVRSQYSLDGTYVRVGVVSDGLKGIFESGCTACAGASGGPIANGDLPAANGVRNSKGVLTSVSGGIVAKSFRANGDLEGLPPTSPACSFSGAGAEGTALLEIVHDMAPGSKLTFANGDTDLEFEQAVNFLAASNDVVIDDVGFYGEPYDGSSGVSQNTAAALNNNSNPIRAYVTSVGNDADEHYYGLYTASSADGQSINGVVNPGRLHLFQRTADTTDVLNLGAQPYNLIQLPQNGEVAIFLTWDDPFGRSSNNYDLYLVQQSTGRVVAKSVDVQNGSQDPAETIDYVNTTGAQDYFRIVVQNVQNGAQPRNLNIFSFQPECAAAGPAVLASGRHERHNYNTAARSVAAQSDAGGSPVSVISVGAICSASSKAAGGTPSDESCQDVSNATIEYFSSRGPTLDGRVKPDIAAIDGVSVSGAGGFPTPFYGTSAAVPHMGGVAALVLQGAACLLARSATTVDPVAARAKIRSLLLRGATPLSGKPPDNTFGYGRADALAALGGVLPTQNGKTTYRFDANTQFGASITASQLGFVDPNSCALTRLNWTGDCGTGPASTMTCGFGTSSVSVGASNGLAFSSFVDMSITVSSFNVAVTSGDQTVTAGNDAVYQVRISPQDGPYTSDVTLACNNLPPGATCFFEPTTLRPNNGIVRSLLTVKTTGASSSSSGARAIRRKVAAILPRFGGRIPPASTVAVFGAVFAALACWPGSGRRRRLAFASLAVTAAAGTWGLGSIALSAAGGTQGVAVFPGSLTFADQTVGTTSPPQLVYITNLGDETLSLYSINASSAFPSTTSCGTSVAPGVTCQVAVSFQPTAAGSATGTISVGDSVGSTPQVVNLSGNGLAATTASGQTPTGNFGVTITGTSGTLVQTTTATLNVQ